MKKKRCSSRALLPWLVREGNRNRSNATIVMCGEKNSWVCENSWMTSPKSIIPRCDDDDERIVIYDYTCASSIECILSVLQWFRDLAYNHRIYILDFRLYPSFIFPRVRAYTYIYINIYPQRCIRTLTYPGNEAADWKIFLFIKCSILK